MPLYTFTGTLTLSNVQFNINAPSAAEAMRRARFGQYDSYSTEAAVIVECGVKDTTCGARIWPNLGIKSGV